MKNLIPSEQRSRTVSSIIVAAATVGMLAVLVYIKPIWSAISNVAGTTTPFMVGFGLAFLQLPIVKGVDMLYGAHVAARDLRGGAALAIAGLRAEGETIIEHAELIDRGYERLEEMLCALGADARRVSLAP